MAATIQWPRWSLASLKRVRLLPLKWFHWPPRHWCGARLCNSTTKADPEDHCMSKWVKMPREDAARVNG